jgi:hypothetical protein
MGFLGKKRQDDYRPPRDWRLPMWAEYMLIAVVVLAMGIVIYFVADRVISLFQ